jgi:hypothetical protein
LINTNYFWYKKYCNEYNFDESKLIKSYYENFDYKKKFIDLKKIKIDGVYSNYGIDFENNLYNYNFCLFTKVYGKYNLVLGGNDNISYYGLKREKLIIISQSSKNLYSAGKILIQSSNFREN